jgi:hypothetical protein
VIDEDQDGANSNGSSDGGATRATGRASRRKDGRPFAEGNVREDGDYRVGKGRTPEHTRFAANDGRRRGKRPKGSRNFDKDWEEELSRKVSITRDGRELRVSAHHAQVMTTMSLAAKGRERSQELVFRKASEVAERKRSVQSRSDDALIAEWMAQQQSAASDEAEVVGDDDPQAEASNRSDTDDSE